MLDNLDKLAQDGDWNVRFTLAQVLAAFVRSNECKHFCNYHVFRPVKIFAKGELPKEGTDKLAAMAIEDRDYDVRSESVNSLAAIVANEGQYKWLSVRPPPANGERRKVSGCVTIGTGDI